MTHLFSKDVAGPYNHSSFTILPATNSTSLLASFINWFFSEKWWQIISVKFRNFLSTRAPRHVTSFFPKSISYLIAMAAGGKVQMQCWCFYFRVELVTNSCMSEKIVTMCWMLELSTTLKTLVTASRQQGEGDRAGLTTTRFTPNWFGRSRGSIWKYFR